jgi:hypothetical protein
MSVKVEAVTTDPFTAATVTVVASHAVVSENSNPLI